MTAAPVRRTLLATAVSTALVLTACGDDGSDAQTVETAPSAGDAAQATSLLEQVEGRTIIDVRTPAEFAEGHLADAVNVDVQDPGFDQAIGELPKDGRYLVYCRSGNRSAAAVARMADLGFTDVVDGGGFDALVSAGVPTA